MFVKIYLHIGMYTHIYTHTEDMNVCHIVSNQVLV